MPNHCKDYFAAAACPGWVASLACSCHRGTISIYPPTHLVGESSPFVDCAAFSRFYFPCCALCRILLYVFSCLFPGLVSASVSVHFLRVLLLQVESSGSLLASREGSDVTGKKGTEFWSCHHYSIVFCRVVLHRRCHPHRHRTKLSCCSQKEVQSHTDNCVHRHSA